MSKTTTIDLPASNSVPTGEGYEGCLGEWSPIGEAHLAAWSDGSPDISAEFYVGDLTAAEARSLAAALLAAADAVDPV